MQKALTPMNSSENDGPVDVIIAPRCTGQASMGGRRSGDVCRGSPNDAWASRVLVD